MPTKTCDKCGGLGKIGYSQLLCVRCLGSGKLNVDNKKVDKGKGEKKCFIATAVYGSPAAPEVDLFRQFRDQTLLNSRVGIAFVETYYRVSPPFARLLRKFPVLKTVVRSVLLNPLLRILKAQSSNKKRKG